MLNFFKKLLAKIFGKKTTPKPTPTQPIKFQKEGDYLVPIISSLASENEDIKFIYYKTPIDLNSYHLDTLPLQSYPGVNKLKPFWDVRYLNEFTKFTDTEINHSLLTGLDTKINDSFIAGTSSARGDNSGCVIQTSNINNVLANGFTINLYDAPYIPIEYGGPHISFAYSLQETSLTKPWNISKSGNLMLQCNFDKPYYFNFENNAGGNIVMGLFLRNKLRNKFLNYVIVLYGFGEGVTNETKKLLYDTTSKTVHISTAINDNTKWTTKSPYSKISEKIYSANNIPSNDQIWDNFFRVNISYNNLLAVLKELQVRPPAGVQGQDFGLEPSEWEVSSTVIQAEIEEQGGKSILASSFKGFELYKSILPL